MATHCVCRLQRCTSDEISRQWRATKNPVWLCRKIHSCIQHIYTTINIHAGTKTPALGYCTSTYMLAQKHRLSATVHQHTCWHKNTGSRLLYIDTHAGTKTSALGYCTSTYMLAQKFRLLATELFIYITQTVWLAHDKMYHRQNKTAFGLCLARLLFRDDSS